MVTPVIAMGIAAAVTIAANRLLVALSQRHQSTERTSP